MKKKSLFIIIILTIIAGGVYLIKQSSESPASFYSDGSVPLSSLTKEYANSVYKFSLKIPENVIAREVKSEGFDTVLLEGQTGQGIQILISPVEDDIKILTEEMIRTEIPDMEILSPKTVEIGSDSQGYQGLSFRSDNPAFAGASSEIWFIFHGKLYQLSTYEKEGNLLKSMFETWKFSS